MLYDGDSFFPEHIAFRPALFFFILLWLQIFVQFFARFLNYNQIMANINFTKIDDVLKKNNQSTTSSFLKEGEPVVAKKEISNEVQEVVEHEPSAEVESFVSPRSDSIELPPDLTKMGVQSSNNSNNFPAYKNVKLPISDDKVISGLHAPINSSFRWLATFAIYLLARAHLGLKVVKGQVVRVLKR